MTRIRMMLLVVAFTFCWTATEIMAAWSGVSLLEVLWVRSAINVVALLLIASLHGEPVKALIQTPRLGRQVGRSLSLMGMSLFMIGAMHGMPVNTALAVLWSTPILILIFDRVFTREVSGRTVPLMTISGYVGVLLILEPVPTLSWSALLALGAAVCLAFYIVMTRAIHEEGILPKLFHTALWAAVALTPFLPFFWQRPTGHGWLALAAVGLFGGITLFLICRCVEEVPSTIFAPAVYGIVVWSEVFECIVQHITPSHAAWLGSLLAIGSLGATLWIGGPTKYESELVTRV